ncbi:hypothetical protein Trydic_g19270 [Trypoxylus dichotomus]
MRKKKRTGVEDVMERVPRNKWRWRGHLAKQERVKLINHILKWRPRLHKRNVRRPPRRWVDDIREKAGKNLVTCGTRIRWKEKD